MITVKNIAWAVGLIEGEGSFQVSQYQGKYSCPRIAVASTDLDIIGKLLSVFRLGSIIGPAKTSGFNRKPLWYWKVNGKNAISIAMTILPFLGERRKARSIEMIAAWRKAKLGRNRYHKI